MGLKKLEQLLKEKKIPKAEYDRRIAQRAMSLKGQNKRNREKVKAKAAAMPMTRSRGNFSGISVKRVAPVQNALNSSLLDNFAKEILAYVATLVAPENYASRIPDAFPKQTALYKSSREFEIPMVTGDPATNNDVGRFAVCVQPKLGPRGNILEAYNVMVVDTTRFSGASPTTTFATADWSDSANYLQETTDGIVLYRDPQFEQLIVGPEENAETAFTHWSPMAVSYEQAGILDMAYAKINYAHVDFITFPQLTTVSVVNGSYFKINALDYKYNMYVITTFRTNAGQSAWTAAAASEIVEADGVALSVGVLSNTTDLNSTNSGARIRYIEIQNVPADAVVSLKQYFTFSGTAPTSITYVGMTIMIEPIGLATNGAGLITAIRPVGCSVLGTWRGEILHNAGNISAAIGLTGSTESNWLTNNPNGAWQPQKWESYATVPITDRNIYHGGPIDKGAYVWWKPAKEEDTFWKSISAMGTADYPPLFMAGRYVTTSGTAPDTVLRCRVETVYEYQTASPLISTKSVARHPEALVTALTVLDQIGLWSATENPLHLLLPFLAKLGIGSFLTKAAGVAGTAALGALSRSKVSYNSKSGLTASLG
jgi:hypothetical protein